MTDREKVIKGLYHISNDTRLKGFMTYWGSYYDVATDAIALLKAQEPKPPIIKENSYGWKFYYCPSCEKEFYQNNKFSFCEKCGQAVRWG